MRIDEARHDDEAVGVDHLRAGQLQVATDRDDLVAVDRDVTADDVVTLDGHDIAAADQDLAAGGKGANRRRVRGGVGGAQRGERGQGRGATEHLPPAEKNLAAKHIVSSRRTLDRHPCEPS